VRVCVSLGAAGYLPVAPLAVFFLSSSGFASLETRANRGRYSLLPRGIPRLHSWILAVECLPDLAGKVCVRCEA